MSKRIFKSVVCLSLVLVTLVSLVSCSAKIERYDEKVLECIEDGVFYDYDKIDGDLARGFADFYNSAYDIDVEMLTVITAYYVVDDMRVGHVVVAEFENAKQAKQFEKMYKAEMDIGFFDCVENIFDCFTGTYYGSLTNVFNPIVACERDGNVVIYGNTEAVKILK